MKREIKQLWLKARDRSHDNSNKKMENTLSVLFEITRKQFVSEKRRGNVLYYIFIFIYKCIMSILPSIVQAIFKRQTFNISVQ